MGGIGWGVIARNCVTVSERISCRIGRVDDKGKVAIDPAIAMG